MERIIENMGRNGTTLHSEHNHRLSRQPSRSDAYEDLGQSGFHASGSRKGNATKHSTSGTKKRNQPARDDDNSGGSDELNLTDSTTSALDYDDEESSRREKTKGQARDSELEGQDHAKKALKRTEALKTLHFKKKGQTHNGDAVSVKEKHRPNPSRAHPSQPPTSQSSDVSQSRARDSRSTAVVKRSRPGPRTVISSGEEEDDVEPPRGSKKKRANSRIDKRRAESRSHSRSPGRETHRKPRAFPMSPRPAPPIDEPSRQSKSSSTSRASGRGEDADRTPAPAKLPRRLPLLSPPSSYNSTGSKDAKGKGKARTNDLKEGSKVRPFPMMVDDASESDSPLESVKTHPIKRLSDDATGDSSKRKKFKADGRYLIYFNFVSPSDHSTSLSG